ncbi:MAG: phycobilisome linker polypeptide [Geitlerinemataceae cyanobacterium]
MYNPTTSGVAPTTYTNRMFVYEVEGLGNKSVAGANAQKTRQSGRSFISVTYSRMNQEMKRILRLGGKIVAIHPAESFEPPVAAASAE